MIPALIVASTTAACEVCDGKGVVQQILVMMPGRRPWRSKVRIPCVHCKGGVPLLVTA